MGLFDYFRNQSGDPADKGTETEIDYQNRDIDRSGYDYNSSEVTLGQVLDAFTGTGYDDILGNFYKPRFYNRNQAVCYATLSRGVSLISGVAAYLLSNGHFRICKEDGSECKAPKSRSLKEVLTHTMDGRNPSSYTIQDAMADLLTEGNAILFAERMNGRVVALHRAVVWSAEVIDRKKHTGDVYRLEDTEWRDGVFHHVKSKDVIHCRWAHLNRYGGTYTNQRIGFAPAPIRLMRPAVEGGMELDRYVKNFADYGPIQQLYWSTKTPDGMKDLSPKQIKALQGVIKRAQSNSKSVWGWNDISATDLTPKFQEKLAAERTWQAEEVGRFYGIPGPLLGIQTTAWGSGIQELSKLAKNYSFMMHIEQFTNAIAFKCLDRNRHIELDWSPLMQADADGTSKMLMATGGDAQRDPIASIAERRKMAGLPKEIDGEIISTRQLSQDSSQDDTADDDEGDDTAQKMAGFQLFEGKTENEIYDLIRGL